MPIGNTRTKAGAHEWNRTIDLFLTKEVLYRLSYVSASEHSRQQAENRFGGLVEPKSAIMVCYLLPAILSVERETGIEPAPSAWKAEVLPLNYSRTQATEERSENRAARRISFQPSIIPTNTALALPPIGQHAHIVPPIR